MRIITLEEHYLDPAIAAASAPLARELSPDFAAAYDPASGLSYTPTAQVLQDLGDGRPSRSTTWSKKPPRCARATSTASTGGEQASPQSSAPSSTWIPEPTSMSPSSPRRASERTWSRPGHGPSQTEPTPCQGCSIEPSTHFDRRPHHSGADLRADHHNQSSRTPTLLSTEMACSTTSHDDRGDLTGVAGARPRHHPVLRRPHHHPARDDHLTDAFAAGITDAGFTRRERGGHLRLVACPTS